MSEKQDSVQRIQVGVMGLAAVLLVVSLANLVIDRASKEAGALDTLANQAGAPAGNAVLPDQGKKSEPLAEMGLTPAPTNGGEKKPTAGQAPDTLPPASQAGTGQIVPDLRPDPKLESRMDREP
jgi:hypothetical protein